MKKNNAVLILLISCLTLFSFNRMSDEPAGGNDRGGFIQQSSATDARILDANNISTWYRNNGSFNRNPETGNAGFEWPKGSVMFARYASGIWMGCITGADTLTAIAEYSYDYKPGYVDNAGLPQGNDNPLYRIYAITRGDTTSADYQNWPANQGAYTTSSGKPYFLGSQTMFYSYTDAYPHESGSTSIASLKAQILQTNWCYTNIGYEDIHFIEYKVINRNTVAWNNTYIAMWTDDDLGDAVDDAIGCDTALGLGYTYNITNTDQEYGANPPAVGTKLLRSPIIATGNSNDTVKYYDPPGSQNLRVKVGYKFIGMSIFNTYNNTTPEPGDPGNNTQIYNVLSGLWRTGQAWTNPTNSSTTKKVYSGDPVTGTGWVMTSGGDRRSIQSFGPFTMSPGDTQSIIIAQVIARGSSNLNSITQLRNLSVRVQTIYDQNFQSVLAVHNISSTVPDQFYLNQNYPNPFNPSTVIRYSLTENQFATLKIFNALGKEVSTLVNQKQNAGVYEVTFDGSSLSSGIYFYSLSAGGLTDTKRMILVK